MQGKNSPENMDGLAPLSCLLFCTGTKQRQRTSCSVASDHLLQIIYLLKISLFQRSSSCRLEFNNNKFTVGVLSLHFKWLKIHSLVLIIVFNDL